MEALNRRTGRWCVLLMLGMSACVTAPGSSPLALAMDRAPVTLVPRAARGDVVTARLSLSDSSAAPRDAGFVELRARGDTALEYNIRFRGVGEGMWATAHLFHSSREGAPQEQIGALFVGAAFSPTTVQVRGTVSVGKTIPIRWLVDELRANPGRFQVVLTDSQASAVTLRGRFQ